MDALNPHRTTVFIRDLDIMMLIGIHAQEKGLPQRVLVNVDMNLRPSAAEHRDILDDTVSYEGVVAAIIAIAGEGHIGLVETFARRIASYCLSHARVESVRVRVEKPDVFDCALSVGAEIEVRNI